MADPRIAQYARVLVEQCLKVEPGWQVLVRTTPLAAPLVDELGRQLARRGAFLVQRVHTGSLWPVNDGWAEEAPLELLERLPQIDLDTIAAMDARITIFAPANTRDGAALPPARRALVEKATRPFFRRSMAGEIAWVGCQYPTEALAQEGGMTLAQFEEFLYGACLRDFDALGAEMHRHKERFDAAREIRIVGPGTDLRLSTAGRPGRVDTDWLHNVPSGEFFFAPLDDSAEGAIELDLPSQHHGSPVEGVRLVFRGGVVVEASARVGEEALLGALDTDGGSRRIGELGIGCNPGVTKAMRNTLFDEKMAGTIHVALGAAYPEAGGVNESALHWDLVKDMRLPGCEIRLDGETVQREGAWLI